MARLSIQLLGPFQVTLDGEPITGFHAETAQALLAYLAMHAGIPCRRTSLAGLLWSDYDQSSALTNLRQALRRLRTAIGDRDASPPFLQATRATIALNSESDYWLDVDAFTAALDAVRSHTQRSVETCVACEERLAEAVELYRGEFITGFSLDSALFEEWMVVQRERLHGLALDALGHLAAYHAAQEAYEQAARYARRALALEPWREKAHRALMRALALSGQRGAALAQYEACREVLREELGIEPEEETRRLYERICDGHDLTGLTNLSGLGTLPPHNLPAQLTPFIGRERELAEVAARLADPNCRLLTLVGPGGSGKTRLALEAAARERTHYPHGVFFVPLAPLQSAEAIAPAVAQALGLCLAGGDPKQVLVSYLREKQMLLVLDNYEHLLDGVGLATDLLRAAPQLSILVTSRARLSLQSEHLLLLSGLDYPAVVAPDIEDAAGYSGVQLYLHTARRVRPGYVPTAEDLAQVVAICRLVEGMPLALLLAASWTDALSPAQVAAHMAEDLDFLEGEVRDLPPRQRSMRAVFDASWRLLAEQEQQAFAALSVFRGGLTVQAAEQVAGAGVRTLRALLQRSFLQVQADGRYGVHELLRQYGEKKLNASADGGHEVRDRHCNYYAGLAQGWHPPIGAHTPQIAVEMHAEIDNVRAAWSWAVQQAYPEAMARLSDVMAGLCDQFQLWQEGESAFGRAVERISAVVPAPSQPLMLVTSTLAGLVMQQGHFSTILGHLGTATRLLAQSQALLERLACTSQDVRAQRTQLSYYMGERVFWQDMAAARPWFEESLALSRELDPIEGPAGLCLGIIAYFQGDYPEATRRLVETRRLSHESGNIMLDQSALSCMAKVAVARGDLDTAERLAVELWGPSWDQDVGDREFEETWDRGEFLAGLGRYAEAAPPLETMVTGCRERGSDIFLLRFLERQTWVEMHLGQYGRALAVAKEMQHVARRLGNARTNALATYYVGCAALAERRFVDAEQCLAEAIELHRAHGNLAGLGEALNARGFAAWELGRGEEAWAYVCEALAIGLETEGFLALAGGLAATALLLANGGARERAVELWALLSRHPQIGNSRWYEDVAGQHIAALAADLPGEVVAAAQERGRARDLGSTVEELLAEWSAPR
jgi:predicted ATPase/DNA-binding SARP family transcriptional activator